MKEKIGGIYKLTHIPTGRAYIGSSRDVAMRWRKHQSELRLQRHKCTALQKDYSKAPEVRFELLEQVDCDDLVALGARERAWIGQHKAQGARLYNELLMDDRAEEARVASRMWDVDRAYKAKRGGG